MLRIFKKKKEKWNQLFKSKDDKTNVECFIVKSKQTQQRNKSRSTVKKPRNPPLFRNPSSSHKANRSFAKETNPNDISSITVANYKSKRKRDRNNANKSFHLKMRDQSSAAKEKDQDDSFMKDGNDILSNNSFVRQKNTGNASFFNKKLTRKDKVRKARASQLVIKSRQNSQKKHKVPLFAEKRFVSMSVMPNSKGKAIPVSLQKKYMQKQLQKRKSLMGKVRRQSVCKSTQNKPRSVTYSQNVDKRDVDSISAFSIQDSKPRINVFKKDILDVFNELKLDANWIKNEFDFMRGKRDAEGHFIEFQNKVITVLGIKLKKEKESRLKAEKQLSSLKGKFAIQQELLNGFE